MHTLLLHATPCLHLLVYCLNSYCLDLLILHVHLIQAGCSKRKNCVVSASSWDILLIRQSSLIR